MQGERCSHHEVLRLGDCRKRPGRGCRVVDTRDTTGGVDLEGQQVAKIDELEDGLQLVIAVGAARSDVQAKIEFRRRGPPRQIGGAAIEAAHRVSSLGIPCQASTQTRNRKPSRRTSMRCGSSRRLPATGA